MNTTPLAYLFRRALDAAGLRDVEVAIVDAGDDDEHLDVNGLTVTPIPTDGAPTLYEVIAWHWIPATRWEPEDVSDAPVGTFQGEAAAIHGTVTAIVAARVDAALEAEGESYWLANNHPEWT